MRRAALWLLLWLTAPVRAERIPDGAFVRTAGPDFVVSGRRVVFLGANVDGLHGEHRDRYRDTLRALVRDGMTVGRQWVVGEGPVDASLWARRHVLVRAGPEGFLDAAYAHLDHILAEARELGLRLILTLANHWPDYGGVPAYLAWAGRPADGLSREAFYSDERIRAFYRAGLDRLLLRTNTVTGIRYTEDPTIFAWELMNESVVLTAAGAAARRAWIVEMARYIRARDPNHLIAPGLLGYATRAERREWVAVHQLPEVDYCDSHLYPEAAEGAALARLIDDALDDRAQLARHVIGKPLLIGEFGFRTDRGPRLHGQPRAQWLHRFLARVLHNGSGGALLWIYEPFSGTPRDFGIYIDRADTDDLRQVVRTLAPRFRLPPQVRNPRLSAARGEAPLHELMTQLHGPTRPHSGWVRQGGQRTLHIPPDGFALCRFERAGVWAGGAVLHTYGADTGHCDYRFVGPGAPPPTQVRIAARLSSEWPGASAPPEGGSEVRVLLDGHQVGRLHVVPDDGVGRWEEIRVEDPVLLRRLADGVHTLRFAVPEGPAAHGLALYGPATGREPAPPGEYGPLRITYLP
ncbi:MAG: hypothetical protein RMK29_10350 [Myxococcales bacterium]|nr:hypothetical protein [Myxococcota bacterium]MDW8282104.1 hypothetical protein [Myxococcales bacterium]